mgnify:CR=1 FL=1
MRLPPDTLALVKQRVDLVALIQAHTALKKRGRQYTGLCPFHSEKTPSFTVSPDKGVYYCFGCQASGDAIGFVMAIDSVSFIEAVSQLAGRVGVPLPADDLEAPKDHPNQAMYTCLDKARLLFIDCLKSDTAAQAYLKTRGIPPATQSAFSVGVAPSNTLALLKQLGSPETLIAAGLLLSPSKARFQSRIMFPIFDHKGRTVGFGGRLYQAAGDMMQGPKYLNSPETAVFAKSRLLYGWYQAQAGIRQTKRCIVVEGYTDVLVAHAHAFTETVGTMGTTVSGYHTEKLRGKSVYLALDSDQAGHTAMAKISAVCDEAGIPVSLVDLDDTDPADFLCQQGPEAFADRVAQAVAPVLFHIKQATLVDAAGKRRLVETVAPFIQRQSDPIIKHDAIRQVAVATGLSESVIQDKLQLVSVSPVARTHRYGIRPKPASKYDKAVAIILHYTYTADEPSDDLTALFDSDTHRRLYTALRTATPLSDLPDELRGVLAAYLISDESPSRQAYDDAVRILHANQRDKQVADLKAQIRALESSDSPDEAMLVTLVQKLSELLTKKS